MSSHNKQCCQVDLDSKAAALKDSLREMGRVAVAFSGGTDSTLLLKVAHELLGDNVVAVTVKSSSFPQREFSEAVEFVGKLGIKHAVVETDELGIEGFPENPLNRCYLCKKDLFSRISDYARTNGFHFVADGSNFDDTWDYRPGMRAVIELGIRCPLLESGLGKEDIRALSKEMGLPTWDKPALACLATRFPYGERITKEKLEAIDMLERFLIDIGFRQVRVRHHGIIARIEVAPDERVKFFNTGLMDTIDRKFRQCGFIYTALDLRGYRTGSMNENMGPVDRK